MNRRPSSETSPPIGSATSPASAAEICSAGRACATSAIENTVRTPGSDSSSREMDAISSNWDTPAAGSNTNSPVSGVAPPKSSSVRSNAARTGSSALKKNS